MILKIAGLVVETVQDTVDADFALTYAIDELKCQIISTLRPSNEASVEITDSALADKYPFGILFTGAIKDATEVSKDYGIWSITALDNTVAMDARLVVEEYSNVSGSDIALDLLAKYAPDGFSNAGVELGAPIVEYVQFPNKRLSECLKWLCDYLGWQWYVDARKVVQFFKAEKTLKPAPINIAAFYAGPSPMFDFRLSVNTENIRNRIKVEGGSMLSDLRPWFEFKYDGIMRSWSVPHKPHELSIYVSEVQKTVGIENIDDSSAKDFLLAYQDKRITMGTAYAAPASGSTISHRYRHPIPVITVVENTAAQKALAAITGETGPNAGVREHVVIDDSISTLQAAEALGDLELRRWADPEINGSFQTYVTGWEPGQLININQPERGLNNTYMVQRVHMAYRGGVWITEVSFGGRLVSVADFLQALVSKQQQSAVQTVILQKYIYIDETITLTDEWFITERSNGWMCGEDDAICGDVICLE